MRADRVEVSWDSHQSKWQVRIQSGEEVIRRYCSLPKAADDRVLRSVAETTVHDEGYELDSAIIQIRRPAA
jgi:hypothetical protein